MRKHPWTSLRGPFGRPKAGHLCGQLNQGFAQAYRLMDINIIGSREAPEPIAPVSSASHATVQNEAV